MASGLLSLKWNNHRSTFFHVLSTIRSKESYCDVTLACDGRFYSLHKFVLSTCSEYFEEMFERTQCKHPVIVLKDIKHDDLEALLNYMYVGEVNVVQEKLAGLIKAAECLKIKGLAVPDEDPMESKENLSREQQQQHKRSQRTEDSPRAKRRRRENSTDVSDGHNPARSRNVARSRDHNNLSKSGLTSSEENQALDSREDEGQDSEARVEDSSYSKESRQNNASNRSNRSPSSQKNKCEPEEVTLDDDEVKPEPIDPPPDEEDIENHEGEQDNKDALHHELGFDNEGMGGDNNYDDMGDQLQNMEDVVADAMPGSSGYQENSFPMWEGEGSLSNFPVEGFSGDNSQARQMTGGSEVGLRSSYHHHLHLRPPIPFSSSTSSPSPPAAAPPKPSSSTSDHFSRSAENLSSWCSSNLQRLVSSAFNANAATDSVLHTSHSKEQESQQYTMKIVTKTLPNLGTSGGGGNGDGSGSTSVSQVGSPTSAGNGQQQQNTFRVYECSHCDYSSASKNHMQYHVRKHTGEQPFQCVACGQKFSVKSNLLRHFRTMHRDWPVQAHGSGGPYRDAS